MELSTYNVINPLDLENIIKFLIAEIPINWRGIKGKLFLKKENTTSGVLVDPNLKMIIRSKPDQISLRNFESKFYGRNLDFVGLICDQKRPYSIEFSDPFSEPYDFHSSFAMSRKQLAELCSTLVCNYGYKGSLYFNYKTEIQPEVTMSINFGLETEITFRDYTDKLNFTKLLKPVGDKIKKVIT